MIDWSNHEPRLTAASTPAGMPMETASMIAQSDSSSVAGNSVKNSWRTGRLVTMEVPKSPCRMLKT